MVRFPYWLTRSSARFINSNRMLSLRGSTQGYSWHSGHFKGEGISAHQPTLRLNGYLSFLSDTWGRMWTGEVWALTDLSVHITWFEFISQQWVHWGLVALHVASQATQSVLPYPLIGRSCTCSLRGRPAGIAQGRKTVFNLFCCISGILFLYLYSV